MNLIFLKVGNLLLKMPFGDIREAAGEKTFNPVEDRFVIKNNQYIVKNGTEMIKNH